MTPKARKQDNKGTSIQHLLHRYNVGTQKSKNVKEYFPDPNLMLPIRLLLSVNFKSIKKRGVESTNMIGVKTLLIQKRIMKRKEVPANHMRQLAVRLSSLAKNLKHRALA